MKILLTYSRKWDWYDALCIVFAGAICMWISTQLMLSFWPTFLLGALLGYCAPHLAAFLRHPPTEENPEKKS